MSVSTERYSTLNPATIYSVYSGVKCHAVDRNRAAPKASSLKGYLAGILFPQYLHLP